MHLISPWRSAACRALTSGCLRQVLPANAALRPMVVMGSSVAAGRYPLRPGPATPDHARGAAWDRQQHAPLDRGTQRFLPRTRTRGRGSLDPPVLDLAVPARLPPRPTAGVLPKPTTPTLNKSSGSISRSGKKNPTSPGGEATVGAEVNQRVRIH